MSRLTLSQIKATTRGSKNTVNDQFEEKTDGKFSS